MIQLDLSRQEAETLVAILEHELSDLSYEIANTDSLDFRDGLRKKKAVLSKVLEELTANRQSV